MVEKELTCVSHKIMSGAGNIGPDVFVYSGGRVSLSTFGGDVSATIRITREVAMKLAKNIEDAVSEYDAGRDEYTGEP